jgi:threonine dehydratase
LTLAFTEILEARRAIAAYLRPTPLEYAPTLSAACGAQVYLKLECFQATRAFKVRGALNKLAHLTLEERDKGVIAASGGNHALGVAWAAARLGIKATVVIMEQAPESLAALCRGYGAKVLIEGKVFEEALETAERLAALTGQLLIHAYDDPFIIAGQGTVGLEVLQDLPEADAVIVPTGGGGLLAGIALACKTLKPNIEVIGVQPEAAPAMTRSLAEGRVLTLPPPTTIAEKLAVQHVGQLTFSIAQRYVDRMVLVSEEEVREAIRDLLARADLLTEGAAAVTWAALQSGKLELPGKRVVLIISGGNISLDRLRAILGTG